MRKLLITTIFTIASIGVLAPVAQAGQIGVNAARQAVAWDSNENGYVFVDTYGGNVNLFGSSYFDPDYPEFNYDGIAWFTVRITDVGAGRLTVKTPSTGDCTGRVVTFKRKPGRPSTVIVRITHTATGGDEFDCTYKRIGVRW